MSLIRTFDTRTQAFRNHLSIIFPPTEGLLLIHAIKFILPRDNWIALNSLTHPLTDSPTHSLTHSRTHPSIHLIIHPLAHSPINPFIHPPIHPPTYPPNHSSTHSLTHSFIHSSIRPSIKGITVDSRSALGSPPRVINGEFIHDNKSPYAYLGNNNNNS